MSEITVIQQIKAILQRVRLRLLRQTAIDTGIQAAAICFAVAALFGLAGRFFPIYAKDGRLLLVFPVVLFILFYTKRKTVTIRRAAFFVDRLGLEERCITALELAEEDSPEASLQRKDTLEKLKSLDWKSCCPIHLPKRPLYCTFFLGVLAALILFIPNSMEGQALARRAQKKQVVQLEKNIDEVTKKVKQNQKLAKKEKDELKRVLASIKEQARKAENKEELEKTLQRSEKKLEIVKDKVVDFKLEQAIATLEASGGDRSLSKAMKNGDTNGIKKALKAKLKELQNMKPSEQKAFAESLNQLASELGDNPALAAALSQLTQKLASGELGDLSDELTQLSTALDTLSDDIQIADALSNLSQQMGQAVAQLEGEQTGGAAEGIGQGKGKGAGLGQGTGAGQGAGAGSGTNPGEENQKPSNVASGGISHKSSGTAKTGEYEKIFTSKHLGGSGQKEKLNGQKGTGGQVQQKVTGNAPATVGESVAYDQVLGSYRDSAYDRLNHWTAPTELKDIVKDYFSSLEE